MAILGKFTATGVERSRDASNDLGFVIIPHSFGVSRDASSFDSNLSVANSGEWYVRPISSRVNIDYNTVKIVCTIPQNAVAAPEEIREVYVYAKDSNNNDFVLAFGQPSDVITYTPDGTVTMELQLALVDIDVTANYLFTDTKQTELDEHLNAPDAHPEYAEAMAKAGIFIPTGMFAYDKVGQSFDEKVDFAGTKAIATTNGISIYSRFNGDELNGKVITFDGIKTFDEIITDFNNSNPKYPVDSDATGLEVFAASVTIANGTYEVEEKDLVYKRADGLYDRAIADGTDRSKILGMAFRGDHVVRGLGGFVTYDTGFPINTDLFLSDFNAGKMTNISTSTKVGHQAGDNYIFFGAFGGGGSGGSGAGFDAIVSETLGFKRFSTLQEAINEAPNYGFILVEKLEELKSRVRTFGKTVNIVFRGYNTGLKRFLGQNEIQQVSFSAVPTSGTWRIEFVDTVTGIAQFGNDLPFNSSAALVESEINLLTGHNGCVVTGNFLDGFTFTFNDYIDLPLITFLDNGQNEIQRFELSDVPTDGTVDFEFEGESGANHAFNDTPDQLFRILLSMSGISDVEISGGIEQKYYEIEFKGVDGLENHNNIIVSNSNLNVGGSGGVGGVEVAINGQLPSAGVVPSITVAEGRFPSHNLLVGTEQITLTVTESQKGLEVGPSKAIELDSHNNQVIGLGRLVDFSTGIDMSSFEKTRIELNFENTDLPIDGKGQIIGRSFNFDGSLGIERDVFDAKPVYDYPTGLKDTVNSIFYLTQGAPNSKTQFALTRDELWLDPSWYTLEGDKITLTKAEAVPGPSQSLRAWYTPDILDFTPDITYELPFYEFVTGLDDEYKVPFSNPYTRGSDRLEFYRNGVLSILGTLVGGRVEKYQEFSTTEVGLSLQAKASDMFTGYFKGVRVLSKGDIVEKSNVFNLKVPFYNPTKNDLLIYRNGVLMNASGKGTVEQQYVETDNVTVTLAVKSKVEEVFTFVVYEFTGTREDIDGIANSKIISLNSSIANGTTLVFRNGILIQDYNNAALVDKYIVNNNFEIELGLEAQLNNFITIINSGV